MEVKRKSVTKNPLSGGTGPSGAGAAAAAPAQQAMGRGGGQQLPAPADFSNRVPPVDRDQMVMLVRRTGGSSSPSSRGVLLLSSPPPRAPFKTLSGHSGVVHFVATPLGDSKGKLVLPPLQ